MKTSGVLRYIPAIFIALSLGFALAACGGSGTQSQSAVQTQKFLLTSAVAFDQAGETITLPLYKGIAPNGAATWYVITDASDRDVAERIGVNWAPKLVNAIGTAAVQQIGIMNGLVVFKGTVDFSPLRVVLPGPTVFPPAMAVPGSVGDELYTPLITNGDGVVLNAPQVANDSGLHEKVMDINFDQMLVTLRLTAGLYHGKGILYLSTDASDPVAAALEESTLAPNMNAAPGLGSNDPLTSARAAIVALVNGQTGAGNPERQGLISAILGEGSPLNVTEIHPRHKGEIPLYSPLWDVHPAVWTDAAIAAGERRRVDHHEIIADLVEAGLLVNGGQGPANPALGGLKAADFIVNCPILFVE